MCQTKYASAVPKNLGLGFDFRPCNEGDFLTGRPESVIQCMHNLHLVATPPAATLTSMDIAPYIWLFLCAKWRLAHLQLVHTAHQRLLTEIQNSVVKSRTSSLRSSVILYDSLSEKINRNWSFTKKDSFETPLAYGLEFLHLSIDTFLADWRKTVRNWKCWCWIF